MTQNANLPSTVELAALTQAGIDHAFSGKIDWDGFDEILRKGLHAMREKGGSENPQPPPVAAIELLEMKTFSDFLTALYTSGSGEVERRVLVGTRLQHRLQYFSAVALPTPAQMPAQASGSDDSITTQLAMFAIWVRLMGIFPGLGPAGVTLSGGKSTVGIRAMRSDWAKPMSTEDAFDAAAEIATDFYRMLPRSIAPNGTFTFQIVTSEAKASGGGTTIVLGAPPGARAPLSREITI